MKVGNTPVQVRGWLNEHVGQGYIPPGPSQFERAHFGTWCSRCGATTWLCLSETGLPASRPHIERTLAAARESEF